jgi:nucleolar protein 56
MVRSMVSAWYGAFLLEDGVVVRAVRATDDTELLRDRLRLRREGHLTPEEEQLLSERNAEVWTTRDRRLAASGLRWDPEAPGPSEELRGTADPSLLRIALIQDAERSLEAAWDPSIHVEEAVRAVADLDRVQNLIGERLGSWVSRDAPEIDRADHRRVVESALEASSPRFLGPSDPALKEARQRLAELYRSVEQARSELEHAVASAVPQRTPNLVSLLGPELSARLLAQAGGLERLARLPASTIQVLGAERAFFEHLRGHAPPPRHGLLFLHPALQSAGRVERGRLARALAGKVAIAARLDQARSPVNPSLERAFAQRRDALRARRSAPRRSGRRDRSRPPLDSATGHR